MSAPKRNLKVLNKDLPVGTEVELTAADFTSVEGVTTKDHIKAIEFSVRDEFDFRFSHKSGEVASPTGSYRLIKGSKGQTLFHEDLELPILDSMFFNNPSGTGTTVLEVVFSHG